jgi:hypothetical protein
MPFADAAVDDRGIETGAVVGNPQDDGVALAEQRDVDDGCLGMLESVGEQFPRGAV